MRANLWHEVGRQLGKPSGWQGRALGRAMRLINRTPNQLALAALSACAGEIVLELGFGPGEAVAALARAGCGQVHGIDHSAAMVAQAVRRNRRDVARGRVNLRHGDFARLPYPTASFDKVLAVNVAYFWRDARAILGEIRRVLRPGGTLVIYVTDGAAMQRWRFAATETHRLFDADALASFVCDGGFEADHVVISKHRVARGLTGLVARCRLGRERASS